MLDEIVGARIVIDGVAQKLRVHAESQSDGESAGLQASRATRLGNSLTPTLRELVLAVLAARPGAGLDGRAAFELAQAKTHQLITDSTRYVQAHRRQPSPPFPARALHTTPSTA